MTWHVLQTETFWHYGKLTCLCTSKQQQWTHLWHFIHSIELQPTHSPQTPQRYTFETLIFFPNNNCIPFVLSTFTFRPFPSTAFFYLTYLFMTSFNDSPHKARSSAYNNSINEPSLTSPVRTSIIMINKSEIKADPSWPPTFTEVNWDGRFTT